MIPFEVTPVPARAFDRLSVKLLSAACAAPVGPELRVRRDRVARGDLDDAAPRRSRIPGTNACAKPHGRHRRFPLSSSSHSSSGASNHDAWATFVDPPALLTRMSTPPSARSAASTTLLRPSAVARSPSATAARPPAARDLARDGLCARVAAVHDDLDALARQEPRRLRADARARAGARARACLSDAVPWCPPLRSRQSWCSLRSTLAPRSVSAKSPDCRRASVLAPRARVTRRRWRRARAASAWPAT